MPDRESGSSISTPDPETLHVIHAEHLHEVMF
jgi:hypothetical protein